MSASLRKHQPNDCYDFEKVNKDTFFSPEMDKALVLYGEMNTVLKICAHPDVDLKNWWKQMQCGCMGLDPAPCSPLYKV